MQSPVVERALSSLAQFRQSPEADAQADPAAQADAQDVDLSQAPTDEKRASRTNVVRTSVKAEPGGAGLTGGTEADTDSAAAEADSPAESVAESPQPTADDTDAAQTTGDEAGAEQDSAEPTSAAA